MSCPKKLGRPRKGERERQIVLLVACAEFAAEQLTIAIDRGASVRVLDVLVAQRVAALEELQAALGEGPDDFEFMPEADRTRPKNRRSNKPNAA